MAPDPRENPTQEHGEDPHAASTHLATSRHRRVQIEAPGPAILQLQEHSNQTFYSHLPKLNHNQHSDDLRFSKSMGHCNSDDGYQVELPVLHLRRGSSLSGEGVHAEVGLRDPYKWYYYPHVSLA